MNDKWLDYGVVKTFILYKYKNEKFENNIETTEIGFFDKNEIPENLAVENAQKNKVMICFDAFENHNFITAVCIRGKTAAFASGTFHNY